MDYQIRKIGRCKKVGIPLDKDCNEFVWYSRDELKSFSDSILHVGNIMRFLNGHEYQVALALSPVTRNDLPEKDLLAIKVIKTNYKDSRPVDRKCNYAAFTSQRIWEFSVIKGLTYLFQGETALFKKRRDNAFRNAIKSQIADFRNKYLSDHCKANGFKNWHVDHVYPFSEMVKDFLRIYRIDISTIETETDLSTGGDVIKDPKILSEWQCYH